MFSKLVQSLYSIGVVSLVLYVSIIISSVYRALCDRGLAIVACVSRFTLMTQTDCPIIII